MVQLAACARCLDSLLSLEALCLIGEVRWERRLRYCEGSDAAFHAAKLWQEKVQPQLALSDRETRLVRHERSSSLSRKDRAGRSVGAQRSGARQRSQTDASQLRPRAWKERHRTVLRFAGSMLSVSHVPSSFRKEARGTRHNGRALVGGLYDQLSNSARAG